MFVENRQNVIAIILVDFVLCYIFVSYNKLKVATNVHMPMC